MPNYTISAKTSGKSGVAIDTSTFGSLGQMVSVVLTNLISNNSLTGTPEHISISIPTMVSGTNLTSMGRVTTLFVGTAWRLRNGAAGDLNGTLQSVPNPLVFSNTYDLPRNTDTFVISPFVAGPANHKLTIGADSYPKASLNTPFSTGPDLTINDNYTLIGSLFNDTLSASNGNDTVVGGDGADSLKGGAGKDEL